MRFIFRRLLFRGAGATCFSMCLAPACSSAGLLPESPFSDSAAGTTAAVFLKDPPGAVYESMGGAGVALSGVYSVFYNPAGLAAAFDAGGADAPLNAATFSYNKMFESYYKSAVSYARNYGAWVGGVSFLYASQSALEGYDAMGNGTGSFSVYDASLAATFAKKWETGARSLEFGASVKMIHSKLADESATTAAADVGFIARDRTDSKENFIKDAGVVLRNLGFPMRMGAEADPLPLEISAGIMLRLAKGLVMPVDLRVPCDRSPYPAVGLQWEAKLAESFSGALRAGYNLKRQKDLGAQSAWSLGGGLRIGGVGVDYAWVPMGDLGQTHRFSVAVWF